MNYRTASNSKQHDDGCCEVADNVVEFLRGFFKLLAFVAMLMLMCGGSCFLLGDVGLLVVVCCWDCLFPGFLSLGIVCCCGLLLIL